jgi:hypothetical protein
MELRTRATERPAPAVPTPDLASVIPEAAKAVSGYPGPSTTSVELSYVIPAQAGIHASFSLVSHIDASPTLRLAWVPACAGMTAGEHTRPN